MPDGDVLLHTGDLIQNNGPDSDPFGQLKDIIEWFCMLVEKKYKLVVFIAGNHETLLDSEKYDAKKAYEELINKLPPNVIYLENKEYVY